MGKSDQVQQPKKFFLDCLLSLIKTISSIYDFVTLPFYYYNQKVLVLKEDIERIRSKQIDPTDPSSPWRQVDLEPICDMVNSHIDSFDSYDKMLEKSFEVYANRPCYGYRKILEERVIKNTDTGKELKQVRLSDYKWVTFAEFNEQVEAAKKGFLLSGIRSGDTVVIFADTRPEWQIAAQALIRMGVIVGTMYSTLGTDGIVHSINETQITHIVTQEDIVDKLFKLRDKIPTLKTVIYFEPNFRGIRLKASSIRAGQSFNASFKTKDGLGTNRFFNRNVFTQNNCDNYPLMNGHNDKVVQSNVNNDVELNQSIQSDIENFQKKNGMNQHDLTGVISVKSNGITKVPISNGLLAKNSSTKCQQIQYENPETKTTQTKEDANITNICSPPTTETNKNDHSNLNGTYNNESLTCVSFSYLLWLGRIVEDERIPAFKRPTKDDVAMIMYTSGSTGVPKGVIVTHKNIMTTMKSFSYTTKDFVHDGTNTVAAYLPLAHIFEFAIESLMFFHGVKFGFASPHTLTDKSPGLIPGEKGDLFLLKPTVMIIVPLILDRIVQGVKAVLHSEGYFKEQLVSWLIDYKIYWSKFYYKTPLIDKLVCSKIAAALGGRCRYVICGSAPLSPQTQQFVRAALNLKLPQGFGTTETVAATSCQLFDDQTTGNVGLPLACCYVKLESWPEGDYHPTDKPHPRGEILVGGDMISQGYYKLEDQTKEAFFVDEQGIRWYRTGDIGAVLPNGNLKIIDRKKDLVKLQNGEYISLGKVESTLKSNKYLENFCAHANPNVNFIVAMGPVNEAALTDLGENILREHLGLNKSTDKYDNSGLGGGKTSEEHNKLMRDDTIEALRDLEEIMVAYRSAKKNLSMIVGTNDTNNNLQENVKAPRMSQAPTTTTSDLQSNPHSLLSRLCNNKLIEARVYESIQAKSKEANLLRLEIPKKVILLPDEWTAESGLVTAALKIRRAQIYKFYESILNELYKQLS